jgi:hypothetical protein
MRLESILIPVAHAPSPVSPLNTLTQLLSPLGVSPSALHFVHVGNAPPTILEAAEPHARVAVETLEGPVVETILELAKDRRADMIAMPTAGHNGFLDVLRGSTTERVLRHASCPLLALPAA